MKNKLKLELDNTITIKEYKEKTYTVAEVVELFQLERKHRDKYHHFVDTEDLPNWIKKQTLV